MPPSIPPFVYIRFLDFRRICIACLETSKIFAISAMSCSSVRIILQKAVEVEQDDTPEILQRRVMEQAEWIIMPKAINLIANGTVSVVDGRVRIDENK